MSAAAMSSAGPTPSPLHATFLEVLSQLLSPSLEQRQLAEQQLQALQVTEGEAGLQYLNPNVSDFKSCIEELYKLTTWVS